MAEKVFEPRKLGAFIALLVLIGAAFAVSAWLGISPIVTGIIILLIAVTMIIGESIPKQYERYKMWYYIFMVAVAVILIGLIKKGVIPLVVGGTYPTLLEAELMTWIVATFIASLLSGLVLHLIVRRLPAKKIEREQTYI